MFNYAIIIISDTRSSKENKDLCIDVIQKVLREPHYQCVYENISPDGKDRPKKELVHPADQGRADLVITSNGTSLTPRDVTPDATLEVIHRQVPGIPIVMLLTSKGETPAWVLSRVVAEVRGQTLVINLPGNPKAVEKCLTVILQTLFRRSEIINSIVKQHRRKAESK